MDERNILIITNKGDQTKNIADYEVVEAGVKIHFKNQPKQYLYPFSKISIKTNPTHQVIDNMAILVKGGPLRNVQEVIDFG